jgi:acyl-CoA thioester hydrolase
MRSRKGKPYFGDGGNLPAPVVAEVRRRVHFSEVDAMGIVWHGRYSLYFEEAAEELGRRCGLSYKDFHEAGLRAPIVEFHTDYFKSLYLGEEFTARAALIWHEGARLNTEYGLYKPDGSLAASGYTVQLLTEAESGEVCIISPALLERCRHRWKTGEFHPPA